PCSLGKSPSRTRRHVHLSGPVSCACVVHLINTSYAFANPHWPVATLVSDLMLPRNLRAVPVVAGQSFLGLMTADDVRKLDHESWATTPITQVMTPSADLAKLAPDDGRVGALQRLGAAGAPPGVRVGAVAGLPPG